MGCYGILVAGVVPLTRNAEVVLVALVAFLAPISALEGCVSHETVAVPTAPVPPPPPQAHPAYLRALSDLRSARSNLEQRDGDQAVKWDENLAIEAVDRAIAQIKRAVIDDGESLADHRPVDVREAHGGRLHKALDALRAARDDVTQEEDNASASGVRNFAMDSIGEAISMTEAGIVAAARGF